MKKKSLFYLFSLFTVCLETKGQDYSDSSRVIKIYPLQLVFGELRASFEKPMIKSKSLEFGLGIIYMHTLELGNAPLNEWVDYSTYELNNLFHTPAWGLGVNLRVGVIFYLTKERGHEGFYFYPLVFGKYFYHRQIYQGHLSKEKHATIGSQLLIGYKFPSTRKTSFEIYGGLGGRYYYAGYYNEFSFQEKFFTPQLGFTIGLKLNNK